MFELSFLIVTNQEYYQNAKKVVDSIEIAVENKFTYEILICSPKYINDNRVTYFIDNGSGHGETIQAYNYLYHKSSGQYIFVLNDDHAIDCKSLKAVDYLWGGTFKDRKLKITSIGAGKGLTCYNGTCIPSLSFPPPYSLPKELCNLRFTQYPHRYLIMGYPVFDRNTVLGYLNNFIFNPKFKHHYADNWLPFFIGETDGPPLICDDTPLYPLGYPSSTTINDEDDYNLFVSLVQDFLSGKNKQYV